MKLSLLDEIKIYLPKYLTPEGQSNLFKELDNFPNNIDKRFYTSKLLEELNIFQGDGIKDLLIINLPDSLIKTGKCMVISNTCDIDSNNKRLFSSRVCYSPIINLKKYTEELLKTEPEEAVNQHIDAIKKQRITQIFYLPPSEEIVEDSFIFFDRIINYPSNSFSESGIQDRRLFTLSDYGLYLFIVKLSIHFTRIHEGIERGYNE